MWLRTEKGCFKSGLFKATFFYKISCFKASLFKAIFFVFRHMCFHLASWFRAVPAEQVQAYSTRDPQEGLEVVPSRGPQEGTIKKASRRYPQEGLKKMPQECFKNASRRYRQEGLKKVPSSHPLEKDFHSKSPSTRNGHPLEITSE